MSASNAKFILDKVKENVEPMVPIDGIGEWLESYINEYFYDLKNMTLDPVIKRSTKIFSYWAFIDSMSESNDLDLTEVEAIKRSINNELAWAITLCLEAMPNLNIDSQALQSQSNFDLFKLILKKQAAKVAMEVAPYFNKDDAVFSFANSESLDELESRIFTNLLLDVANKIFDVDIDILSENFNSSTNRDSSDKEEKTMAAFCFIADSFFIQNILFKNQLHDSMKGSQGDLLEYIFPRECYLLSIKNILENIESYGYERVSFDVEGLQSRSGDVVRVTFASPEDQDQLHLFFERVNLIRKENPETMPPLPNIYMPDNGQLMVEVASEYVDSINDAFNGVSSVIKIPLGNGNYKLFSF